MVEPSASAGQWSCVYWPLCPLTKPALTYMENAVNVDERAVYCQTNDDSGRLSCLLEVVERLQDDDTDCQMVCVMLLIMMQLLLMSKC